jgi:uncharacterized membrane protein YfcA
MTTEFILLSITTLIAFIVKSITGTGSTTVIIALGVLYLPPKTTIILASLANTFAGLIMYQYGKVALNKTFWIPIALCMIIGSVLGAYSLKNISTSKFQVILGIAILLMGLWIVFRRNNQSSHYQTAPTKASILDYIIGLFSGFCGGFIGVNAPPLIFHFSRFLNKEQLRYLLILIFLPAAIAQTFTFIFTDQLSFEIVILFLATIPSMLIGIYIGNSIHNVLSLKGFHYVLGFFLCFSGIMLLL